MTAVIIVVVSLLSNFGRGYPTPAGFGDTDVYNNDGCQAEHTKRSSKGP